MARSIVIDDLLELFAHKDAKVIYMYFDYQARQNQSAVAVVGNLIKELLYQCDDIPAELELLYLQSVKNNAKPNITAFTQILVSYAQQSPIYAVFDALDECSEDQQEDLFTLFSILERSNFKLLISCRPHLQNLGDHLSSLQNISIHAEESDLENYILHRLRKERTSSDILKNRCLELIGNVHGMYVPENSMLIGGF